ncbi:MAG: hypothetical protein COA50_16025 [Flavobacteriaceae bacterium]|nr:MAG: hypothetical protein COA50_16025 [Flavobacteriaceae bacterium]
MQVKKHWLFRNANFKIAYGKASYKAHRNMKNIMKKAIALSLITVHLFLLSCSKTEEKQVELENGGMVMYLGDKTYNFSENNVRSIYIAGAGHYLFSIIGVEITIEGAGNSTSLTISVSDDKPIDLATSTIFEENDGLEIEFSSYTLFDNEDGIEFDSIDDLKLTITEFNEEYNTISGKLSATAMSDGKIYKIKVEFLNVAISDSI